MRSSISQWRSRPARDLIFGDIDGVVAVPAEHEADILAAAIAKVHGEDLVRKAIETGMSTKQAFDTYGCM